MDVLPDVGRTATALPDLSAVMTFTGEGLVLFNPAIVSNTREILFPPYILDLL